MKYIIVSLIKGEAEKYQQNLLYSIAEKFNVNEAIKRKPPAHITLKYSFETEDINLIEKIVEEFCKNNKKFKYAVKDLNHFDNKTIFIDVVANKNLLSIKEDLIQTLKENTNLSFKEYDNNGHFHVSVAHTDIEDKFENIWKFLSDQNPEFDVIFDNISILKLDNGIWKVYKECILD